MSGEKQKTILLVDDEAIIAMTEKMILEKYGYKVIIANSGEEAVETVEKKPVIDLILMDINLGAGIDGTEAAAIILLERDLPVVFLSGHNEPEIVAKTEKITSYGYVVKNSGDTVLQASIKMAFKLFEAKTKEQEKESQREAALEALRESEERLRDIIFSMADWVWEVDENGVYTYSSEKSLDLLGSSRIEIIGKTPFDFMRPDEAKRVAALFAEIVANKVPITDLENWNIGKNGERICLLTNGVPILDEKGNLKGYRGVDKDITERKWVESQREAALKALQESEQRLNFHVNNSPLATIEWTTDFIVTRWSVEAEKIFGWNQSETIGKPMMDLQMIYNEDIPIVQKTMERLSDGSSKRVVSTNRNYTKEGKVIICEWYNSVLLNPQGKMISVMSQAMDITERKRAEEALSESEERFRRVSAITSDIAYSCRTKEDGCFSIDWMTGATNLITGYTSEEIKAQGCWRFLVVGEDLHLFEENVIGLAPGSQGSCELRLRHKNGSMVWIASFADCVEEAQTPGHLLLYGGLIDITKRKHAESQKEAALEALRESEEKFRGMTEQLEDVLFTTDNCGTITYISPSASRVFGWLPGEMIGKRFVEFLPEDEIPKAIQAFQAAVSTGQPNRNLSLLMKRRDNSVFNGELKGSPFDKKRGVTGSLGLIRDITEHKQAESQREAALEALRESEERYRNLVENASDLVYRTDKKGNFTFVNRAAVHISGYEEGELIGKLFTIVIRPDMRIKALKFYGRQLGRGINNTYFEIPLITKDGREVWLGQNSQLIVEAGQVTSFQAVARDITERKRAEAEIKRQLAEKEILLKEVHHRIKNNIASIGGLISLHMQSITNPEAVAVLQEAIGRVNSMRLLYDKLLLSEDYEDISVKNYLNELIETIIAIFPDHTKITIKKRIADFNLDSRRLFPLGSIINELLTNTMKYAFIDRNTGLIKISLTNADNHVMLTIQDNGSGLPDGFDINESKGFGLMLVKMLSQQLGGSFSIKKHAGTRCKIEFNI